jgi:hypothetical protein
MLLPCSSCVGEGPSEVPWRPSGVPSICSVYRAGTQWLHGAQAGHFRYARRSFSHLVLQVDMSPTPELKNLLRALSKKYIFYLVSGRVKSEMVQWFSDVPCIGIASEHGFYQKAPGQTEFVVQYPGVDCSWKDNVRTIMQMYADSTDGTYVQEKACGLTWAYAAADPDFGRWQVRPEVSFFLFLFFFRFQSEGCQS